MTETAVRQQLGELARRFQRDGYRLYVIEETARRLYRRRETAEIRLWTDADVIYLARALDDVTPPPARGRWSAAAALGATRLLLACDPLAAGVRRRERNRHPGPAPRGGTGVVHRPRAALRSGPRPLSRPAGLPRRRPPRRPPGALAPPGPQPAARLERLLAAAALAADEPLEPDPALLEGTARHAGGADPRAASGGAGGAGRRPHRPPPHGRPGAAGGAGRAGADHPGAALRGCPQDKEYHPEGDVWSTLECFRAAGGCRWGWPWGCCSTTSPSRPPWWWRKRSRSPATRPPVRPWPAGSCGASVTSRSWWRRFKFYIRHHLLPKLVRELPEVELGRANPASLVRKPGPPLPRRRPGEPGGHDPLSVRPPPPGGVPGAPSPPRRRVRIIAEGVRTARDGHQPCGCVSA